MRTLFKCMLWIFIASTSVLAQKRQLYTKSFDTNTDTTFKLNLENSSLFLLPSDDGKIHIDYSLEFEGYSKKLIKNVIDGIIIETASDHNDIVLTSNSVSKITNIQYLYTELEELVFDYKISTQQNDTLYRKSRDSLLNEIIKSGFKSASDPIDGIDFSYNFKKIDKNGKRVDLDKGDIKIIRSHFSIKIPPYIKIEINAKDTQLNINHKEFINQIEVDLKKGNFYAKKIDNQQNKIKIDDAFFKAKAIIGGDYTLNNIKNGLIGSLKNVTITSEFSRFEIGEIEKNVSITDFNSTYWFHNFSDHFKNLDIYGEYTKVNLFEPTSDFGFVSFGQNIIHYIEGLKIESPPSRGNDRSKRLAIGGEKKQENNIEVSIDHGIVRIGKEHILAND